MIRLRLLSWLNLLIFVVSLSFSWASNASEGGEPSPTHKPNEASIALAREHYSKGATLYNGGEYQSAIRWFLRAHDAAPSSALSYNIALAYEGWEKESEALSWYRDHVRRASKSEDVAQGRQSIASLEEKLAARGIQQLTVFSVPEDAKLSVDGVVLGRTPWTGELEPGWHQLRLEKEGYEITQDAVKLEAHEAGETHLTLKNSAVLKKSLEQGRDVGTGVEPDALSAGMSQIGADAWILLGAGATSLFTAVLLESQRVQAEDAAETADSNAVREEFVETSRARRSTAWLVGGAGIIFSIAGGIMLGRDIGDSQDSDEGTRVGLQCGLGGCRMLARGIF